jgi:hypothetical protein
MPDPSASGGRNTLCPITVFHKFRRVVYIRVRPPLALPGLIILILYVDKTKVHEAGVILLHEVGVCRPVGGDGWYAQTHCPAITRPKPSLRCRLTNAVQARMRDCTSARLIPSAGKCVVVNNIGSFGEIPDECCIKLPSVEEITESAEVDMITNTLDNLLCNPDIRKEMSIRSRIYAEQNLDIHIIIKQYVDYIRHDPKTALNENILQNIKSEITQYLYTTNQIMQLAYTLGYSKNISHDFYCFHVM